MFSVRVANCGCSPSLTSLIDGLMCVLQHRKSRNGTRAIVNLSIAVTGNLPGIFDAVWKVSGNDIPIVASAGNGHSTLNFDACKVEPAGYKGVVTIGATDMDDKSIVC